MSDILCRRGSVEASARERFLDIVAPAGERHHLLARIALKFPSAIGSGHLDRVAETLCFARQFGPIDRGCEALRAINLDRIEASPRAVWALRHVRDDDVGMEMRVGPVTVIDSLRGPGCDVIEARSDDVARAHPFAAPVPARGRAVPVPRARGRLRAYVRPQARDHPRPASEC